MARQGIRSKDPTPVDEILAEHKQRLEDARNQPVTTRRWSSLYMSHVDVDADGNIVHPTRSSATDSNSPYQRPTVMDGHKKNTDSARTRKAKREAAKAKPTGNRGSGNSRRSS